MENLVGQTLGGRYEVREVIGTGGMAIVYKAYCTVLHRYVAIKVLKEEFSQDEEFRKFVGTRRAQKREALVSKVLSELDSRPMSMSKAIRANFSVWDFNYQYSNEANMPARTYELEIQRMKDLTVQRAELLDKLFR